MHAVHFAGEIERIESDAGNSFLLFLAEVHLEAQPSAAIHANELAACLDKSPDFFLRKIHSFHIDDDFEVEPVDVLVDDVEGDLRLYRLGLESGKVLVGDDLDFLGK